VAETVDAEQTASAPGGRDRARSARVGDPIVGGMDEQTGQLEIGHVFHQVERRNVDAARDERGDQRVAVDAALARELARPALVTGRRRHEHRALDA